MSFPELFDKEFYQKLLNKKEFDVDNSSFYTKRQQFIKNYINPETPYNSIMLMHATGSGKTLTSIAIAEGFRGLIKNNKSEKTIIITKNTTIKDIFIKELSGECCKYKNNTEEKKTIVTRINKQYDFITFGSLVNRVLGAKQSDGSRQITDKLDDLSNRVIIIDEFHNILGNDTYNAIQKLLYNSVNYRLILLSATPFVDGIDHLYQISNLLNEKSDSVSKEEFDKLILKKENNLDIKNDIYFLTKEGEDVFKNKLRGKVSFLDINDKYFPKKVFKGVNIIPSDKNSIKIFKSVMDKEQLDGYNKAVIKDKTNALYNFSSYASIYSNKKSCKIDTIIEKIKNIKGSVFIYSNYVANGINVISKILKRAGIQNIALSEDIDKSKRDVIIKKFNSIENINGGIIKVLLGSPILSEGITLKNVRQVHIIDPYWNMSKIDQVIGRAVRFNSHEDLPENQRFVEIFLHAAVGDKKENFIDYQKYMLSYYKDISVKKTERFLKKIAIDCHLNVKNISKDFSRECDYDKCQFKCDFEIKDTKKDKSSFYNNLKVDKILRKNIISMFNDNFVLTFEDIVNKIKYTKPDIVLALQDILDKRIETDDGKIIIYKNGLYMKVTKNINSELFPEILFLETYKEDNNTIDRDLEVYNKGKVGVKKERKKEVVKSEVQKIESSDLDKQKEKIYKTYKNKFGEHDGVFRIVLNENNTNKKLKDDRNRFSGKSCLSYSKQEVADILKIHFGYELDNIKTKTKEDICKILEDKLK